MNSNYQDRWIIIKCMSTDLENEKIKIQIQQLCCTLLGMAAGKGIAKFLELSSPDIPLTIIAALIIAALVFCTQQILMSPVQITIGPNDADRFEILNNCLCWKGSDTDGNPRQIHSLFHGKFSAVREGQANDETTRFHFYGKPSSELIRAIREIFKEQSKTTLYFFQSASFVLEFSKQADTDGIYQDLAEKGIPILLEESSCSDSL